MNEEIKHKLARWVAGTLLTAIVVMGALTAYPTYRREQALRLQNSELQAKIDEKKREIAALAENQRRFRVDADFVESIARQNRRVYPGELVFVFDAD